MKVWGFLKHTMKKYLFISLILFTVNLSFSQETRYISQSRLYGEVKNRILIDSISETKFILDSTSVYITAIDSTGKQLWRISPHDQIDKKISFYRFKNPKIVRSYFWNNRQFVADGKGTDIIWINFENTHAGDIDKLTGKFTFRGQD